MKSLRNFFSNIFIGGLIVLLPVIIIINIAKWLFDIFQQNAKPLTSYLASTYSIDEPKALLFSLIVVFIIFSFIGMVVRTRFGGSLFHFFERKTFYQIPGYSMIKDITSQITGKQKGLFRKVVLVKVGNTGVAATGFIVDYIDDQYSTVFIPCGPNPTTGFILHLNNENISELNISVEMAMKSVISCGAGSSQFISAEWIKSAIQNTN